jgi:hypothetical protein
MKVDKAQQFGSFVGQLAVLDARHALHATTFLNLFRGCSARTVNKILTFALPRLVVSRAYRSLHRGQAERDGERNGDVPRVPPRHEPVERSAGAALQPGASSATRLVRGSVTSHGPL